MLFLFILHHYTESQKNNLRRYPLFSVFYWDRNNSIDKEVNLSQIVEKLQIENNSDTSVWNRISSVKHDRLIIPSSVNLFLPLRDDSIGIYSTLVANSNRYPYRLDVGEKKIEHF